MVVGMSKVVHKMISILPTGLNPQIGLLCWNGIFQLGDGRLFSTSTDDVTCKRCLKKLAPSGGKVGE